MSTTTALSEADKANTTTTTTTTTAAAEPSRAQHGNDDDRGNNMASEKAEAPSGGGNVNHSNNSNKKNDGSDDAITNDQGDAAASASTSTRTTRTSPRLRKAVKAPPPTPTSERKRKRKNASAGTAAIGTMITATTVTKSKKRGTISNNNSNAKNKNSNDKSAEDDVETNNNIQASTVVNDNDDYDDEDEDEDEDGPKGDGRKNNKGSAKRESYSVAFKAKAVRDFEEWEKEQRSQGNDNPAVRHYCLTRNLGNKYIKFLSPTNGWRSPGVRERILQDAGIGDYKDLARMTDRTKNKSYYAEMEEALLKRLQEYKERNITVSNKTIRQLAKEELRKSTNDEEKVNAFKASNGWVHNFLKRQERKEKDMQRKVKNTQPTKHKNNAKQIVQQKEQGVGDANANP